MGSRLKLACVSAVVLLGAVSVVRTQQNPYRLKQPDQRKLCVECHSDFEDKLKKKFVHTAVRTGECSGCHSPHASSHGKLLSGDTQQICAECHDAIIPANAKSTHQVVADGQCQACHDPHASDNPANLVTAASDLCFTCHKELGAAVAKARFRHSPLEQGCTSCHDPHGSDRSVRLLKNTVPELCVTCHRPDTSAFTTRHMNYPVAKASCTSCHDPHGSNQPALLLDSVHPPVSNRTCAQCHDDPGSATPFATKRPGYELCKGCHAEMVNAVMAKGRLHWPVADQQGCVNCHAPHASKYDKLLKADTVGLCRRCHSETVKRIETVAVKHAPVKDGMCVTCHSPHSANGVFLNDHASMIDLCAACHDYGAHSAHPIGEETVDPRNKNLRVDCLSCHKGHGTDHKWMLLAATNIELCTQCHTKYTR